MSEWEWRHWRIGRANAFYGDYIVGMGGEIYEVWIKVFRRFYFKLGEYKHDGAYWKAVPSILHETR